MAPIQQQTKKRAKHLSPQSLAQVFLASYPSQSRFAESYRMLRTNLLFSFMEKEFRSLVITSAAESEGKSTTVANLAYTLAQTGKRVLMVDADLRKPLLHQLVPTPSGTDGLTGVLSQVLGTSLESGQLTPGSLSLCDLYRLLTLQNRSGTLHLESPSESLQLQFIKGQLTEVNWLTRPQEKKLANLLVKNGLLSAEAAREALARKEHTGQKLGFVLINMGLVKAEELAGYITLHMIEGLRTALQLTTASYRFEKMVALRPESATFNPSDLPKLYGQLIVGEEPLPLIQEKIEAAIVHTGHEQLFLLPAGSLPPKPAELLASERMAFLLNYLQRRYDVLVIDTPPLLPASDTLMLAPRADGVLLVVQAGKTDRMLIRKAVDQLRGAKANLLGVTLNQVDERRDSYQRYYSSYYGDSE